MAVAKRRTKKEVPKDKPRPIPCKCGMDPCVVKLKGGYVVSCRDPVNCVGNFLTYRKKTERDAIEERDNLIRYGR